MHPVKNLENIVFGLGFCRQPLVRSVCGSNLIWEGKNPNFATKHKAFIKRFVIVIHMTMVTARVLCKRQHQRGWFTKTDVLQSSSPVLPFSLLYFPVSYLQSAICIQWTMTESIYIYISIASECRQQIRGVAPSAQVCFSRDKQIHQSLPALPFSVLFLSVFSILPILTEWMCTSVIAFDILYDSECSELQYHIVVCDLIFPVSFIGLTEMPPQHQDAVSHFNNFIFTPKIFTHIHIFYMCFTDTCLNGINLYSWPECGIRNEETRLLKDARVRKNCSDLDDREDKDIFWRRATIEWWEGRPLGWMNILGWLWLSNKVNIILLLLCNLNTLSQNPWMALIIKQGGRS